MSKPLLKAEIKSCYKLTILFMCIITLYGGVITAMYDPELSAGINAMAESMPELFAAFGMQNPGTTLLDFLINYLYGFILILIPFIYIIIMCYKLAAKYVENGSMAYLLNTCYSRKEIIVTQMVVLLSGVFLLVFYAVVFILLCSHVLFPGELAVWEFLVLNGGLLLLQFFLASFCFLFACLFNEIKYSVGIGAGAGLLFFLVQMLSQVNDRISFLKYATPLSLFVPERLVEYEAGALGNIGILSALSVILFVVSVQGFQRRDLPL